MCVILNVFSVFIGGAKHRLNIFHRNILLYVMNLIENIPTIFSTKYTDVILDVLSDLLRRSKRKNLLRIATTTPENDLAAKIQH